MERNLVVIRHAKSDWSSGLPDFERPLNPRGRRDGPAAGRWLAGLGLDFDAAVVSPAVRTMQTWALVAEAAGLAFDPDVARGVYLGEDTDLAAAVRELPGEVRGAVLVGHSPGCPDFVEWVTAGRGEESALHRMRVKYPTAGAAWLVVEGPWADLAPGGGYLREFAVCRG